MLSVDVLVSDQNPATTRVDSDQSQPVIGLGEDGTMVIAWWNGGDVQFRRYTADGTPLDSEDQLIDHSTTSVFSSEFNPKVAVAPDGSFVIGYEKLVGPAIRPDNDVYLDFYDAEGTLLGRNQMFRSEGPFHFHSEPDVDIAADGSVVAVWQENTGDVDANDDVFAQVFDAQGQSLTGAITISEESSDWETDPVVGVDRDGNFVVAYRVNDQVAYRRFTVDGNPEGDVEALAPSSHDPDEAFENPLVSRAQDGSFVIAYTVLPGTGDPYGRWHLFDADGTERSQGSLSTNRVLESVAMDEFGNFVIGTARSLPSGDVEAEGIFFDSQGREIETVAVNQEAIGTQSQTSVAMRHNLLAASYVDSNSGDTNVEFSVMEHRRSKFGVARPNAAGGLTFILDSNGNRMFDSFDRVIDFGLAGDAVIAGDWNGDGIEEIGVVRPNGSGGLTFYLDSNGNLKFDSSDAAFNFGLAGDSIAVGDWNGDGIDEVGVGRSNGTGGQTFFLDSNSSLYFEEASDMVLDFGLAGDLVVVGDWNGDGVDNLGVARSNGTGGLTFFLDSNGTWSYEAAEDAVVNFGLAQDRVVVGDWDGDGVDTLAVVRVNGVGGQTVFPDVNENYEFDLTDALFAYDFGLPEDLLVAGAWEQTPLRSA